MDATAQAELVRKKQVTPLELLEAALERTEQLNPAINAVNYVWADRARDAARDLDEAVDVGGGTFDSPFAVPAGELEVPDA